MTTTARAGGLLAALVEIALSVGGYYLLRASGVGVFWALTAPAVAVACVSVAVTVRRGRVDAIGLLVLLELTATIVLSLVTRSPRVAALRESVYFAIGGAWCLATLAGRRPFSHTSTTVIATFGDPRREAAFARAWRDVPRYRMWQRLLTVSFGVLMIAAAGLKAWVVWSAPATGIAHAVDVSNTITVVLVAALGVGSGVLIQGPRRIIESLLEQPA